MKIFSFKFFPYWLLSIAMILITTSASLNDKFYPLQLINAICIVVAAIQFGWLCIYVYKVYKEDEQKEQTLNRFTPPPNSCYCCGERSFKGELFLIMNIKAGETTNLKGVVFHKNCFEKFTDKEFTKEIIEKRKTFNLKCHP